MKRILFICALAVAAQVIQAQPAARRNAAKQTAKSNADNMTVRARIDFPTMAPMSEDVVWRRDIYRKINLEEDANAGLYYPVEPVGTQMNLFTYIFWQVLRGSRNGGIDAYEYRMDGNEVFSDSAKVKTRAFLDNYHIYYERRDGRVHIDKSDIPSREVKSYYLKESAYYDQGTSTFHRKVVALCPIMTRDDDFGDGGTAYPLFWIKYDDIAPFLSKQVMMTSNLNNAATMSVDDYFTRNLYQGKIYKTNNMLGRTLAQYCPTDSAMAREQKRIEKELMDFESNIFGNAAVKDSTDSVADAENVKGRKVKTSRRATGARSSKAKTVKTKTSSSSSSSSPRVSVRRQRR